MAQVWHRAGAGRASRRGRRWTGSTGPEKQAVGGGSCGKGDSERAAGGNGAGRGGEAAVRRARSRAGQGRFLRGGLRITSAHQDPRPGRTGGRRRRREHDPGPSLLPARHAEPRGTAWRMSRRGEAGAAGRDEELHRTGEGAARRVHKDRREGASAAAADLSAHRRSRGAKLQCSDPPPLRPSDPPTPRIPDPPTLRSCGAPARRGDRWRRGPRRTRFPRSAFRSLRPSSLRPTLAHPRILPSCRPELPGPTAHRWVPGYLLNEYLWVPRACRRTGSYGVH